MAEITLSGVRKSFGETRVLHDLTLHVRDGEFLTLLGASGCGKSTLLRLIAGLEQPDEGRIELDGRDLLALSPSQRNCAMVFQNYALYPHMTVEQNICTPLLMRELQVWQRLPIVNRLSPRARQVQREAREAAGRIAQGLGLHALLARKPAQLSGGQRQRVALARAMVRRPAVFLFDEPLSNLDAHLRQALRAEIRQLHAELGVTFVYVTHDQHEAMSMSDRVAVMQGGAILQLDEPRVLHDAPASLEVARFIGAPRMNLISGQAHGDTVRWQGGDLALAIVGRAPALRAHAGAPAPITIGFRPHAVGLARPGDGQGALMLHGRVRDFEYTGSEVHLSVGLPEVDLPVLACLPSATAIPGVGEPVALAVRESALHLFGPDGQRLTHACRATARPAEAATTDWRMATVPA